MIMPRNILSHPITTLIFLLTICTHSLTYSEEVRIPIGQQAQDMPNVDMPTKGMNKEKVKNLFGNPIEEAPPKGTPPISRWRYQEFTVYFDRDTVIHSVRNFQPKTAPEKNTKPNLQQ